MSSVPPNTPGTPSQQPAAGQPVYLTQPVAGQPPVVMQPGVAPQQVVVQPAEYAAPTVAQERAAERRERAAKEPDVVIIISHSNFFYWWPVWVCGYIMAAITWFNGVSVTIPGDNHAEWFHPSKDLGVIFTLTLFLVILITNFVVRGMASVVVILAVVLAVVLSLYFGWWETLATWYSLISFHMNLGFYVCFSTMIFIVWFLSVFVYDRMSYWRRHARPDDPRLRHRRLGQELRHARHGLREAPQRPVPALDHWAGIGRHRDFHDGGKARIAFRPQRPFRGRQGRRDPAPDRHAARRERGAVIGIVCGGPKGSALRKRSPSGRR